MAEISIIIPCYNVKKYIDRCLNSLVRQTIGLDRLELILVDDASTDGTLERLYQWEKRYPESILVVACRQNGRQGKARNIGMEYASGTYISFIDADDWVERNLYEKLYDRAIHSELEVIAAGQGRDYGDGVFCDIKEYRGEVEKELAICTEQDRHALLAVGLNGGVVGNLYRRDFLQKNHIRFPEGLTYEDNYFEALVIYSVKRVYILEGVYYHYFYNPNSTVSARNSFHQLDRLQIEKMKLEELRRRGFEREYREEMLGSFLKLYYINTLHLIFTRFDEMPYDILEEMRREVWKQYPDWKEGRAYQKLSDMEKGFLLSLEQDMSPERWDRLAENYRYLVRQKGRGEQDL